MQLKKIAGVGGWASGRQMVLGEMGEVDKDKVEEDMIGESKNVSVDKLLFLHMSKAMLKHDPVQMENICHWTWNV